MCVNKHGILHRKLGTDGARTWLCCCAGLGSSHKTTSTLPTSSAMGPRAHSRVRSCGKSRKIAGAE